MDVTWHGVRVPNALDGVPGLTGPAIAPGASRTISFAPTDAGTFWYHAFDAAQTRRALAGALTWRSPPLPLRRRPHAAHPEPGAGPGARHAAHHREWRGLAHPSAPSAARARLRLINASVDFLKLHVVDAQSWVMAIDGQPTSPSY